MAAQLSSTEQQVAQAQLQGFAPATAALNTLAQQDGDLEESLMALLAAEAGAAAYGLDSAGSLPVMCLNRWHILAIANY
ncbi:MAG: hypothetical protein ACPGVO_18375 [Spirulinaceae cyanobacterium]